MDLKRALTVTVACLLLWPAMAMGQQPPDAQSRYMPTGPAPEEGYQPYDLAVRERGQKVIANVPGYLWRHGCGPTAAGMVVGYWDGQGMPLLIPGAAGTQTNAVDQAIATGDGANTHYSDYSLPIDSPPDPPQDDLSEPPPGDEHASDSLADFMETSWSSRNNYYGWSWFSDVDNSLLGYVGYANATYGAAYQASSWNEQLGLFTWAKFCTEINADRPMVFLVDSDGNGGTDHFVTAIGWRDTQGFNEYACFDTWAPAGNVRWERFRAMSSTYDWGIYGATYFLPTGACCLDDGSCIEVDTEEECTSQDGIWKGEGTTCLPEEACCLPDGSCIMADPECCVLVFAGTPHPGETCDTTGACCLPDYSCVTTTQFCCDGVSGTYQGDGTACLTEEDNCTDGLDNDCDGLTDGADPDCPQGGCVCGDINQSGGPVDLTDFATFALCFGLSAATPNCDADAFECSDLNGDLIVDLVDFATFALTFGQISTNTVPNCP